MLLFAGGLILFSAGELMLLSWGVGGCYFLKEGCCCRRGRMDADTIREILDTAGKATLVKGARRG